MCALCWNCNTKKQGLFVWDPCEGVNCNHPLVICFGGAAPIDVTQPGDCCPSFECPGIQKF